MKITISQEGKLAVSGSTSLFLEDVNYALDGGLYAEMLENRNFEAKDVHGEGDSYTVDDDGGYAWSPYPADAKIETKIKSDRPLFAENPHYLRLKTTAAGTGVKNKAYDGIYLTAGMTYKVSFHARSYDYKGKVIVGVYQNGAALIEKKIRLKPDGKWHRHSLKFKAKKEADQADFAVTLSEAGTVHLDCFSMIPENAIKGVFRRDLAELMKNMTPGFLCFPGGCGVEDNKNRCLWKESLGQAECRKHTWNRWALHGAEFSHYGNTLGVGLYEYFLLCEYLGAKPLPSVSISKKGLEECIQDTLDLIEFANGETDTEWGNVRQQLGHPEPFRLEYLNLRNEKGDTSDEHDKFFEIFEQHIHEKYPEIKIIGTAGSAYATHIPDLTHMQQANSWESALAEAAFMTGMERNNDVVILSSYAPLFARLGYTQWTPNMIWFNGKTAFVTADYHVQKLYSLYTGNFALTTTVEGEDKVYASASEREGLTYLKLVNMGEESLDTDIDGDYDFGEMTRIICMQGDLKEYNTIEKPLKIAPLEVAPSAARSLVLPPHSFSVLVFRK